MAYRNYSAAVSHIVDTTGQGDFTTIGAALTAAVTGQTIVIRPGTYPENPNLKAGVNLVAFDADALTPNVIINGNCTASFAGTCSLSGICLQTNSANCLTVSGSSATIVNLINCFINCTNNTGISYSSSSASSQINLSYCELNLATTGIAYYSMSSTGGMEFIFCTLNNTGVSTTAANNSSGGIGFIYSLVTGVVTTSSTGILAISYSIFNIGVISNTTPITTAGTGSASLINSQITSGSASAISIGAGTSMLIDLTYISSTNTNAITGAGTCNFSGISYNAAAGATFVNNVTTQSGGTIQGIAAGNNPTAGYIGEQIRSYLPVGSAVTFSTSVIKEITTITLSAGVWDISAIAQINYTGVSTSTLAGISTTSTTFAPNNLGDNVNASSFSLTGDTVTCVIPAFRVAISTSTSYFMNASATFSTGAATGYGRISATRVG
jgi:hypothetical protein